MPSTGQPDNRLRSIGSWEASGEVNHVIKMQAIPLLLGLYGMGSRDCIGAHQSKPP